MQENRRHSYLLPIAMTFLLFDCNQDNNRQQHLVSAIISTDSVIIYSGKLGKNTPFQKVALDEKKIKKILTDKKNKANEPVTVLLKLSNEGGGAEILGNVMNIKTWSQDLGITNFEFADADVMDLTRFRLDSPPTWRFLDSFFSQPLHLNMPRDAEVIDSDLARVLSDTTRIITPKTVIQPISEDNAFIIEIKKDQSVWYQILTEKDGLSPAKVKQPVSDNLKKIIADYEKNNPGTTRKYLIKGDPNTKYTAFEKVIEALKQNNIFKYNLVTTEN